MNAPSCTSSKRDDGACRLFHERVDRLERLRAGVVSDDHDRDVGTSLDRRMPDIFQPDRAVDDVVSEPDDRRSDLRESVGSLVGDQDLEFRR